MRLFLMMAALYLFLPMALMASDFTMGDGYRDFKTKYAGISKEVDAANQELLYVCVGIGAKIFGAVFGIMGLYKAAGGNYQALVTFVIFGTGVALLPKIIETFFGLVLP